jgi:hypothetical protein
VLGIFLAFVPAMIFLSLKDKPFLGTHQGGMFGLACGVSILCCLVSSFALFRYKAEWVIVVGLMFFLLNVVISFALGCGAILSN